jgi:hypothetical protein
MHRALRLLIVFVSICSALLFPSVFPNESTPRANASVADQTIVVFIPGVCFPLGHSCAAANSPYRRSGYADFGDIRAALDATFKSASGVPHLTYKCFNYSDPNYSGSCGDFNAADGAVPYSGTATWQPVATSASRLNSQLARWRNEAQAQGNVDPRFIIVSHSLGGFVAGFWAATSQESDLIARMDYVVTLDSPMLGSLWDEIAHQILERHGIPFWLLRFIPGEIGEFLGSAVVENLRPLSLTLNVPIVAASVTRVRMINIANFLDVLIPFPTAIQPFSHKRVLETIHEEKHCDPTLGPIDIFFIHIPPNTRIPIHHCDVLHANVTFNEVKALISNPGDPPVDPTPITPAPAVPVPPTIAVDVVPDPNGAGWHNAAVTVVWFVTGETSQAGCDPKTVASDTSAMTFTCTASNDGGAVSRSVTIRLDTRKPTIELDYLPPPNAYGWHNKDVTVRFSCTDERSGVAFCSPDVEFGAEGRFATTGVALDVADNENLATAHVMIDKTPPVTEIVMPPAPRPGWYTDDVHITLNASDPILADGTEGSGIQYIQWQLNGGGWQNCALSATTCQVVVTEESLHHVLEYRSIDKADNVENAKSEEFILLKHVLFAADSSCSGAGLFLDASRNVFGHGKLHTNGSFVLEGSRNRFDGAVTGTCGVRVGGSRNQLALAPAKIPAKPIPPNYVYSDFASACTMTFTGNVELSSVRSIWVNDNPDSLQLEPGVYCAAGNMTLTPSRVTGNVTLVATGQVRLRGSYLKLTAFHKHILAFSGSSSATVNAISMEGSANTWEGIVLAPNGRVSVSGTNSTSAAGAIIAKRISSTNSEAAWSLPE